MMMPAKDPVPVRNALNELLLVETNVPLAQEQKSSGLHGLNRFKTVLGRRRQSTFPYTKGASPERKTSSTNLGSSFFGKGKNKDSSKSTDRPGSPSRRMSEQRSQIASRASDISASPKQSRVSGQSADKPNGTAEANEAGPSSDLMNGTKATIPELQEPLQPSSPTASSHSEVS
jgi:F-BAR domain only protein